MHGWPYFEEGLEHLHVLVLVALTPAIHDDSNVVVTRAQGLPQLFRLVHDALDVLLNVSVLTAVASQGEISDVTTCQLPDDNDKKWWNDNLNSEGLVCLPFRSLP